MKNMSAFLAAASFGVTFAIVFTIVVVIAFIAVIVLLWWVDVKKKPVKEFWKAIGRGFYKFFDKIYEFFTVNSTVKTVYSDKSLNFSGTEFLPVPTKAPTDKYTYEFVGWDKNGVDQNGNFVVRAIYLQRVIKCYINIYDDDKATLLKSAVVEYGAGVNLDNLKPSKPETKEFSYEFVGWDKDITAFYGNTNVCAVYKAIPKKYTYTFFDEDGKTVVSQGTAIYGTPIICPAAPQKESTDKVVYEFAYWKNYSEGMLLTKDCSFVALYEKQDIDTEVASSVIKTDGTIVRAKKQEKKPIATSIYSEHKPETTTKSKLDNDDYLNSSVNSQLMSHLKPETTKEKETKNLVQETADGTKILHPAQDEEIHQKIQLVTSKEAKKIESEQPAKQKTNNTQKSEDDELLKNMVVNRIRIKKK